MTVTEVAARVASIHHPAEAEYVEELTQAALSFVAGFCARNFDAGTFTETHPGGGRYLFLQHYPCVSATVTGLAVEQYWLHAERGVIEHKTGRFAPGEWLVSVTVAPDTMPESVLKCVIDLVGHWYRESKTHEAQGQLKVASTTTSGGTTNYPWGQSTGYAIPSAIRETLKRHRHPAL